MVAHNTLHTQATVTDLRTDPKSNCGHLQVSYKTIVTPSHIHSSNIKTIVTNLEFFIYTVFQKKTSTHIIGYKLKNSCLILIIFDIKIPHII